MKNKIAVLLATLLLFTRATWAQWVNLNTGINDNLTGVVMYGSTGFVSGAGGIYYTYTGVTGSWVRYQVRGNAADSITYNHTRFTHCTSTGALTNNLIYFCGTDTVAHKGIVMRIDTTNLSYTMAYIGAVGSSFSHLFFRSSNSAYYAVGGNGLIVTFSNTTATVLNAGLTDDLRSISFSGSNVSMVGAHTIYTGSLSGSNTFTLQTETNNNYTYRDVAATAYVAGGAVGSTHVVFSGFPSTENRDYDYGPLNAACITSCMNYHFVGTDHGIFRSGTPHTYLEYEPSSLTYRINAIWSASTATPPLYACGDNGVVLRSYTIAATKPIAHINASGGCVNTSISLNSSTGSSTTCSWYINNVLYVAQCGNVSRTFTTAGQYTIRLETQNDSLMRDTSIQVINIVNVPRTNLRDTLNKYIICHDEPVTVSIDSSQVNVYYTLLRYGSNSSLGQSGQGTGGTLSFLSGAIPATGYYHLRASSSLAQCTADFRDTLRITDERTRANFYSGRINASPGEAAPYYQHCQDASHYAWSFTPSPTSVAQVDSPVAYATYSAPARPAVRLICWSDHGCYDTLSHAGATIAREAPDSCWNIVNNGTDLAWNGNYTDDVGSLAPCRSGFLVSGHHNYEVFSSRAGDSLTATSVTHDGGYYGKYSMEGTLRWMGFAKGDYPNQWGTEYSSIKAVTEDRRGNIYICGKALYIIDNKGDSIDTRLGSTAGSFIAKCDSDGRVIWYVTFGRSSVWLTARNLTVDYQNNIIVAMDNVYGAPTSINLNGAYSDSLYNLGQANENILKLDSNGHKLWDMGVQLASGNGPFMNAPTVDTANNLYISGGYAYQVDIFEPDSTHSITMTESFSAGTPDVKDLFLFKYDKNGRFKWKTRSYTSGPANSSTAPTCVVTDSTGNTYIAGSNNCFSGASTQVFLSADSSTLTTTLGKYFVARVDAAGKCRWLTGNSGSYYGNGEAIWKNGNTLSVVGTMGDRINDSVVNTLYGTNGTGITMELNTYDYFIATYDTAGRIRKVIKNGHNTIYVTNQWGAFHFFTTRDGKYYMARNYSSTAGSYINFGSLLPHTTGTADALITKVTPGSCGITYLPAITSITASACAGSLYTYHGHQYQVPGQYLDTLPSSAGTDSIVNLDLTALPPVIRHLTDTICSGQSILFAGVQLHTAGSYSDTATAVSGCDSITILALSVAAVSRDTISHILCSGHSYSFGGMVLTASGFYQDTLTSHAGCDSIVTLRLTVAVVHHDTVYAFVCAGAGYTLGGHVFYTAGSYTDTLQTGAGCDSMVTLRLTVAAPARDTIHASICAGGSYVFYGQPLTQAGSYTDTVHHNCDSIITLQLTVVPAPARPVITQQGYVLSIPQVQGLHYQWQRNGVDIPADTLAAVTITQNGSYSVSIWDINHCDAVSDTVTITNVGISDLQAISNITVAPNPSAEGFTITIDAGVSAGYTLSIYDMAGQLLLQRSIATGQTYIDRGGLASGAYIIKVTDKHSASTRQLPIVLE